MAEKRSGNSRATLEDVARAAGVSVTTASLILAGKSEQHRISTETRGRVNQAAADLDYVPNLLVKSLRRGRTHILCFFSAFRNRETNDLYMDRLSTAMEIAVGARGYNLLVYCDFAKSPRDAYRFLNGGHSDGLLFFAPSSDDPLLPLVRSSRQPAVLINVRDQEGVLPSIRDDAESGMRQVADVLAGLGHRRIAAITEPGSVFPDAPERIALLRSCLSRHHLNLPDSAVLHFSGNGDQLLRELMASPEHPTAIFCWRDRIAYFVLEACDRLGIDVPGELSVVGYDGLHWPAATRHVAASINVDFATLAEAAVDMLDRQVRGQLTGPKVQSIAVALVRGTTLGPPDSP